MENKIFATIYFTDGNLINLELYPDVAPITVANFVKLCNAHFYDGLCFHRVINRFMIQGGGYVYDNHLMGLVERPNNNTIKGEFRSNGVTNNLSHTKGTISMARTNVKDSASGQFFICIADVPHLNGEYAAFGRCADEKSIATAVAYGKVKTGKWQYHSDVPLTPIVIKTITVRQ